MLHTKLQYYITYKLARSIVLKFEVDQALHLARANLAGLFTRRVNVISRVISSVTSEPPERATSSGSVDGY